MHFIRQVLNSFRELIHSWYLADRIRMSPSEGRLLTFRKGDRVVLTNQLFRVASRRVASRRVADGESSQTVVYALHSENGPASLHVPFTSSVRSGTLPAELRRGQEVECVFDCEAVVLGRESAEIDNQTLHHEH